MVCDEDMDYLDYAFENASDLNEEERSSVYFISGYVKEMCRTMVIFQYLGSSIWFQDVIYSTPSELFDLPCIGIHFLNIASRNATQKYFCRVFLSFMMPLGMSLKIFMGLSDGL